MKGKKFSTVDNFLPLSIKSSLKNKKIHPHEKSRSDEFLYEVEGDVNSLSHNLFYQNLPTPVLSVSGARVRNVSVSAYRKSGAAPLIFYAVVCVVVTTSVLYHSFPLLSRLFFPIFVL